MLVQTEVVLDGPPSQEEIVVTVQILHAGKAGRPSGMLLEYLRDHIGEETGQYQMGSIVSYGATDVLGG